MNTEIQRMVEHCTEAMRTMGSMGTHADGGEMMGMGSMMGMPGWLLMVIVPLVLIGALVLAVVWVSRAATRDRDGDSKPLDELNRRYARGEIDRDSYLQIRRDLGDVGS